MKDRFGYGTELQDQLSAQFNKRKTLAQMMGLAPKFVPKEINDKDISNWEKFQIMPNSMLNQINTWAKMQGVNENDYLNEVMKTNTYKEEDWISPY